MKKRGFFDTILVLVNSVVAFALLLSYVISHISPLQMPIAPVLSLVAPILLFFNLGFLVYWLVRMKRYVLISLIALAFGITQLSSFFKLSGKEVIKQDDLKVMSYNVRLFNRYNWIKQDSIKEKIFAFINAKNPDVICFQEFDPAQKNAIKYPYKYVKTKNARSKFGQAIYSKYPILNPQAIDFENSTNNALVVDIVKDKDTISVYNVHLESLKINPKAENFGQENRDKLRLRMQKAFKKQATQVEQVIAFSKNRKYQSLICGDFNNTAFSWVYNALKTDKQDAFEVAGTGFGSTFNYAFPLRIDFILAPNNVTINNFETYKVRYSDHFPIMARMEL